MHGTNYFFFVFQQRLNMIRIYLHFSLLACVLVISVGVLNGISYFTFAVCRHLFIKFLGDWQTNIGRTYVGMCFAGHRRPWVSEIVIRKLRCLSLDPHPPLTWHFSMIVLGLSLCFLSWNMTPANVCFIELLHGSLVDLASSLSLIECVYAWVHQSWFQVASVFLFSVLPALIYYILVYAYYRQTIDRNHSACLINTYGDDRSNYRSAPLGRMEQRNNNITHASSRNGITSSRLEYAHNLLSPRRRTTQVSKSMRGVGVSNYHQSNKVGSIPVNKKPPFVSKSLNRDRRPPPLIQSPSPLGLSPGPPSYGPSKVYAAFAAPVLSW